MAALWTLWLYFSPSTTAAFLLPPRRQRAVPWTGLQITLIAFLVLFVIPAVVEEVLRRSSLVLYLYGPDFPARFAPGADPHEKSLALARIAVWREVLAAPWRLAAVFLLPRFLAGARLYQMGLSWSHAGRGVILGAVSFVGVTPLVLALNFVLVQLWRRSGVPTVEHPITRIGLAQPTLFEQGLLLLSAVVAAPLFEELFARGLLQPWCVRHVQGSRAVAAAALGVALVPALNYSQSEDPASRAVVTALAPLIFVTLTILAYLPLRRRFASPTADAIFATALLFGAAHGAAWPTPVSLFVMGLVLGWITWRTQSLVPALTFHALFNAVAFLILQLGQPGGGTNGKDETTASRVRPPASMCSIVPASACPRRT